ncbi:MAG TPA: ATP-binding protein [Burkholderiales bacterium]|nr:ATP-binding protein [Burkholderiales bacterium]
MEKVIMPTMANRVIAKAPDFQHTAAFALALFALYVALDWLTYVFPARFGVTPFNPEAALAVALLMFCGIRFVPLVYLAVLLGEYTLPAAPRPLMVIVINSAILTAGFAAIAVLLTGRFRIRIELSTRRDVLYLMGVTLACMLVCGVAYLGVLISFGIGPADRYFSGTRRFFIGYGAGILVAAPLLFMMFSEKRRSKFMEYLHSREAWLQAAGIAVCIWWVFVQEQQEHVRYFYVLFLPLIWAATRFGMVGATSALAVIQASLLVVFSIDGYQPVSVFELQLLFITLVITGLLLGVSIDEQRRATADFHESLKLAAAGEMAAAITHEINQPLTALSGYATAGQLIAASPDPDRALLNDTMRKLLEESKRTSAVVRRLRDFFRSGATRLERVGVTDLITKVMASLRSRADAAEVVTTCRFGGNLPTVLIDPLEIEVVLRNLLVNAIESAATAGPFSGRVEVAIEINKAGEVVVAVSDSGPGIRDADAERLFDSFVTTKTSGMGMGLAISRAIVDAHGGRLWAVPGTSGLFCFTLPPDMPSSAAASG